MKKLSFKQIKTIDILTYLWVDRADGGIYRRLKVIVNFGMKNERWYTTKFQYGGESGNWYYAFLCIAENNNLDEKQFTAKYPYPFILRNYFTKRVSRKYLESLH